MNTTLKLKQILFTQGFGSRRECDALIASGAVQIGGETQRSAEEDFAFDGLRFSVNNEPWTFAERAYLMLNKPTGFECSHQPKAWPSVYSLLPTPLRLRPGKGSVDGVQAVGRLDQDSTGMLLFSDDGQFIHRMASPKHHVPKVYEVTTADAVSEAAVHRLLAGVVLHDDPAPVAALACERVSTKQLRLTLAEGKYHQVKRMLAAVGNRVETLHRSRIGALGLDENLKPGEWRWLSAEELAAVQRA